MAEGLYFEEFQEGQRFEHKIRRTVTEADNVMFSCMTMNPAALHLDADYCARETEWGKPLVNSLLTLGMLVGISVHDTTFGTTLANLGMTDVKFPAPVFHGDTLRVTTTVVAARASKSREDAGIVTLHHQGFNQNDVLVAECHRQAFMKKQPA